MKYYKVVQVEGGIRYSMSFFLSEAACVRYPILEWAYADPERYEDGYGLCLFDNLECAMKLKFAGDEIWEVEVDSVTYSLPHPLPNGLLHDVAVETWPRGTVMAHGVKLVTRVWPNAVL